MFLKFFKWFFSLLPSFQYLEIANIYIKCISDPSNCEDPPPDKRATIEICFKSSDVAMCIGPAIIPTMAEIGAWFVDQIFKPIKEWFEDLFGFSSQETENPTGVETERVEQAYDMADDVQTKKKDGETVPKPGAYDYTSESDGAFNAQKGVESEEEDVESPDKVYETDVEEGVPGSDPDIIEQFEDMVENYKDTQEDTKDERDDLKKTRDNIDKKDARRAWNEANDQYNKVNSKWTEAKAGEAKSRKALADYKAGKGIDMSYEGEGENKFREASTPCGEVGAFRDPNAPCLAPATLIQEDNEYLAIAKQRAHAKALRLAVEGNYYFRKSNSRIRQPRPSRVKLFDPFEAHSTYSDALVYTVHGVDTLNDIHHATSNPVLTPVLTKPRRILSIMQKSTRRGSMAYCFRRLLTTS